MYGQVSYALVHISPAAAPLLVRVLLAVAVAVAVESIALYVQWHAHDALLNHHTLTAARQRRASYGIALGVATVNYSHFAGPDWAANPTAVCFAMFSAVGPWLWGLHTRRAQRVQLSREGQLDTGGAVFSAERYRLFPVRTSMALRWSIDHGVTDPRVAWLGYNAERAARRAEKAGAAEPPTAEVELSSSAETDWTELLDERGQNRSWETAPATVLVDRPTTPDRPTSSDNEAIISDLVEDHRCGKPLPSKAYLISTGMGSPRAARLLNTAADRIGRPLKELQETK